MERVAVVGGGGFLGRHVVAALKRDGKEVVALSRRTGFDALKPDPERLRGCAAVVNLAGIKREEGPQTFRAVHVDAVERLADAMRTAGVARFVHVSVVVARSAPGLPYHHTKWEGEEAVRKSGLDWTILRPGVIYGDGDDMLSHLSMMIRAAPVFPIVNDGSAPMMPVDARDVAEGIVGALARGASVGRTFDLVGPDRLTLRDVVSRVAEAAGLTVSIWSTPVGLMRLPVRVMEAVMRQPLSTRAQLAMLVEGLAGDPKPARRELGVDPRPFTVERIRPLVERIDRRAPFSLRLFSGPRPKRETPAPAAAVLTLIGASLLMLAFEVASDRWMGMALSTSVVLAACLLLPSVRRRLKPAVFGIAAGVGSGAALYGATLLGLELLRATWPGWESHAQTLLSWRGDHGPAFLGATLVVIVVSEEVLWRGVVTRFLMERVGRAGGIALGGVFYMLAHLVTFNPLLLGAALAMGIVWGWLYSATDDLVAPCVCHLVWDVMMLFVTPPVAPMASGC